MPATDAGLRSALVGLGVAVVLVGIWTWSFKKMMATYLFGMLAIAGVVLPDWEFFDRNFKEWFSPMPFHSNRRPNHDSDSNSDAPRVRIHPIRIVLYIIAYSFGFYKWWRFMIN